MWADQQKKTFPDATFEESQGASSPESSSVMGSMGGVRLMAAFLLAGLCTVPLIFPALGFNLSSSTSMWPALAESEDSRAALSQVFLVAHLQSMLGWITSFAGIGFCALALARYRFGRDPLFPILGVAFLAAGLIQAVPNFAWLLDTRFSWAASDSQA
ncbi:hypothetical protein MK280_16595, partial [Myxococcota bacterium]|nr:hypothetical protein [Myxococcota bacterium]